VSGLLAQLLEPSELLLIGLGRLLPHAESRLSGRPVWVADRASIRAT